ncbi:MAG: hypothetical protein H9897_02640 [Candidatus Ureaplasma intestinipullorum]|uniref:Uncharacterized protein n=1 Tax=Candidatus Ureaplasma intestinipullorum TaxID=2838770 RepID=A0A9E2KXS3_9BACT|nr:hypothetical protein [Candidatus Ureaplasma intestinipullorum]
MKDEILYQLLLKPTPILIDLIYKKYKLMVIKFSSYIINKNFPRLKILEIDFSSYIVDAIQNMKKFKKEIFLKYKFEKLLKKFIVQKIISIEREQSSNKKKVLHNAIYDNFSNFDIPEHKYITTINEPFYNFFISECNKKITEKVQIKIFKLITDGYKPKQISNVLNINIEKVYYTIHYLKYEIIKPIYLKYFE